jgi:virginiamycin B lyase
MNDFARKWGRLVFAMLAVLGVSLAVGVPPARPDGPPVRASLVFMPLIGQATLHPLAAEYQVQGQPYAVAVESPSQAWFTLPERSALGRLTVTAAAWHVLYFPTPTAGAGPYDLAYAAGAVWLTERTANQIARFDIATGAWREFPLPTPSAGPSGIAVWPGEPTDVWFAERDANRLGRLRYFANGDAQISEYPLPLAAGQPEGVFVQAAHHIWFTAPGAARIGRFNPDLWPSALAWAQIPTGAGSRPWAIVVDGEGYPWFTERSGNRIGQFFPQTIADVRWYRLPQPASDPYDLALGSGRLWFTERGGDRIANLLPRRSAFYQYPLSASAPTGIAVDAAGCAWAAAGGSARLVRWCPPYLQTTYLPLIGR